MSQAMNWAEKIRKLLTLANHPGTGAEEAATAAAMAAELGLRHNIDMGRIKEGAGKRFEAGPAAITVPGGDRQAVLYMAGAIAALYGTSVLITPKRGPSNASDIRFAGQPHNIELSGAWLNYLWGACKRTNAEHNKTAKHADKYKADRSFRLHFGSAVSHRLHEKLQAMKTEGLQAQNGHSTSTALVVSNWYETEGREVQEWMQSNLKLGKPAGGAKQRRLDYTAAMAGREAGKKVGLNDQLK